jgi:hypothetical protein
MLDALAQHLADAARGEPEAPAAPGAEVAQGRSVSGLTGVRAGDGGAGSGAKRESSGAACDARSSLEEALCV